MKLFISYRSLDSARVDTLVTRLRALKAPDGTPLYDVWQDKTSILPGEDWWQSIVKGIIDCQVFVFMLSRESGQNANCRAELSYARRRNRAILPLVLEGEFAANPLTGKNDVPYWEHVPAELNDMRAQFLFYEGASFFDQFAKACDEFARKGFRDLPADFPPDPRDASDASKDTGLLYDRACDAAYRMDLATAERLFQRLVDWNDGDFGGDAHEWILLLRAYGKMVRFAERESTRHRVAALWAEYVRQFPKPFLREIFDPFDLRARLDSAPPPPPPAAPSSPLPAPQARAAALSERGIEGGRALPPPFAWRDIPAGTVTLVTRKGWTKNYIPEGKTQTFDVPAFQIAKYPVTNAQYRVFMQAGGYKEKRWWTPDGWQARETNKWTQPRFWDDAQWNGDDYPVVGVSWYEAAAFCAWLDEVAQGTEVGARRALPLRITLPTEQQWQRAAQALPDGRDSGYAYP